MAVEEPVFTTSSYSISSLTQTSVEITLSGSWITKQINGNLGTGVFIVETKSGGSVINGSVSYSSMSGTTTATITGQGLSPGTEYAIPECAGNIFYDNSRLDIPTRIDFTTLAEQDDSSFLNKRGLEYFWDKIDQAKLDTNGTAYATASIPYAKVDSTSTATEYTATVPGITQLRQGVSFWLENGVVTSASGFTVNINNLGAKPVYSNMAAATRDTTIFNVNYTMLFVYDADRVSGGAFICYRGYDANTNTIGYHLRTNSSTLPAKQTGYRYRLWLTSADGQNYVPINTATGTSTTSTKALNTTTPIDPFGAIVYNSTNGTVNADASLPTVTQWTQYTLDMRYQKYPLTLTYPDPVYLQCTPQTTGGALINDVVQALPSTDDGKIYIYLGTSYSATSIELKPNHPVYYYKDGAIRLYTNQTSSGGSSYTAGDGIKIENGVISLDLTNANNVEY